MKKLLLFFIILITVGLLVFHVSSTYLFVSSKNCVVHEPIGIIDGSLSAAHENITLGNVETYVDTETHGDLMLRFAGHFSVDQLYYYDATIDGTITSETIIAGLDWMKSHGVKYVNISLSSKNYSEELNAWITANKDIVTVYASYNNIAQSADYPAMYENVIGSGTDQRFVNAEKDRLYHSSNIIVDGKFHNVFCGNSYLTIWTMLQDVQA